MQTADNIFMKSFYATLLKILRFIEQQLDSETFDEEHFTADNFNIPQVRFCRFVQMLIEEKLVSGIRIDDYGESTPFDSKNYTRYKIICSSPSITIKGMRFIAENCALSRACDAIQNLKSIITP